MLLFLRKWHNLRKADVRHSADENYVVIGREDMERNGIEWEN